MVRLVDNIATLYLSVPNKSPRSRPPRQPLIQTLSSRQRVIPQNPNLPSNNLLTAFTTQSLLLNESLSTKNDTLKHKNHNKEVEEERIAYIEIPELSITSNDPQVHKKILSSIKALSTASSITSINTASLYANLINNDTKLTVSPSLTNHSNKNPAEKDREDESTVLFKFDTIFPLTTAQNFFSNSILFANIPVHSLSSTQFQDLPSFASEVEPRLHFDLSSTFTHKTARNPTHFTLCGAIISQSKSARFTFEIPCLISPKFALQKMNFTDVHYQSSPQTDESHSKLFPNVCKDTISFYRDMFLRAYKVTSHVPSCLLFQPMKVPTVSHAKMRSFDLFQSLGIDFLAENNDHQLFSIFLEPYLNTDRMFALKNRMMSFPKTIKGGRMRMRRENQPLLSLICILPLRRRAEQCEDNCPLAITPELPLPKVPDATFSVDDSLSEFMKIRGKDAHKRESVSTTPLRKKTKRVVVEEKSFFDVGCLLVLSEHFPLFPVISRFLERYRNDNVLWIFNELNTFERFLVDLFSGNESLATISTVSLASNRSRSSSSNNGGKTDTLFCKKFSLIIGGLEELKGVINSSEFRAHFQSLIRQNTSPKFLTICFKKQPAILDDVEFISRELGISYAMGNSSEESLNSVLHQKVSHVKVPSSISKEVTPFLNSPKHSLFVMSLVLQDFDAALRVSSTQFPSLRRCVEILRLEFEAGLFANDAAEVFSEDMLPAISNSLASPESLIVVVSNVAAELSFVRSFIPEDKVVIIGSASKLPQKEILDKVECVFRFECNWKTIKHDCVSDSCGNETRKRRSNGVNNSCSEDIRNDNEWDSKIIEEFLFYHLVHMREKPACFFVMKLSLDGHTCRPTTFDWWNAQDAQRIIYTSSLPEKSAFFYPISQIRRVPFSNELRSEDERVKRGCRPKRIILTTSRAELIKHSEVLQSTNEYAFVNRFTYPKEGENGKERDGHCFIQTDFFSGIVVVFSTKREDEQSGVEYVRSIVCRNSVKNVAVVVWHEFNQTKSFCGLAEKSEILYFKNKTSLKLVLDYVISKQASQNPNENSWVLEDETPNERFLTNLGLSSFVAQFLLASLSLGKILTMTPSELCHRIGLPSLMDLRFFKIVRCIFEGGSNAVKVQVTPKKRASFRMPSASPVIGNRFIQSTPSKMTKILYELPKGNVLGQTKLKALDYNDHENNTCGTNPNKFGDFKLDRNEFKEFELSESEGRDLNNFELNEFGGYPKCKTPRLTAASSPIKRGVNRQSECKKKEICDFISSMYTYKGDDDDYNDNVLNYGNENSDEKYEEYKRANESSTDRDEVGENMMKFKRNGNSPRKTTNSLFAPRNTRLTIPKFDTMRKFPRITFKNDFKK